MRLWDLILEKKIAFTMSSKNILCTYYICLLLHPTHNFKNSWCEHIMHKAKLKGCILSTRAFGYTHWIVHGLVGYVIFIHCWLDLTMWSLLHTLWSNDSTMASTGLVVSSAVFMKTDVLTLAWTLLSERTEGENSIFCNSTKTGEKNNKANLKHRYSKSDSLQNFYPIWLVDW